MRMCRAACARQQWASGVGALSPPTPPHAPHPPCHPALTLPLGLPSPPGPGPGRYPLPSPPPSSQVEDGIPTITLYAEPGVVGLYEKLGYVKDPEGIRGMAFQRKKTPGGKQGQGAGARLLTRA